MYYLLYTMALVSLSQASVIIRWSATDPVLLGAWRLLVAGGILWAWSWIYLPRPNLKNSDQKKIIAAGFAFFTHLYSYAYSAHHTSISHLMLIFSLNPVTTALGSWLFYKERMTRRQIMAYALALVGIYLLAREHQQGSASVSGDMAAMVAALTFSGYALLSQRARRDLPNSVFASRMYLVGSGFFFLTAFFSGVVPPVPSTAQGWVGVALLTLFPTLLGHGIFTLTMKHLPLPLLSLGKLVEPLLAAMSAYLLFGEPLTGTATLAFTFIIFAVYLVVRENWKRGPLRSLAVSKTGSTGS